MSTWTDDVSVSTDDDESREEFQDDEFSEHGLRERSIFGVGESEDGGENTETNAVESLSRSITDVCGLLFKLLYVA